MAATADRLDQARAQLQSAEVWSGRALATLDRCQEQLDWTERFCNRCLAATDLPDVEEMTRQRDDLSEALKQHNPIGRADAVDRFSARRGVAIAR
jgi:hypothetical protein